MTIDLDAIEAAARGATPGEWTVAIWHGEEWPEKRITVGPQRRGYREAVVMAPKYATRPVEDMHHIATMDPQTTLALVDRVRELEELEDRALALQADWENGSDEDVKMGVGRVVDWLRAREASGWKWVDRLSWRRKA